MGLFLKGVFVRAGKHTTVHGVHPHIQSHYMVFHITNIKEKIL